MTAVDYFVFFAFILGLLYVGFRYGKTDETTEDFFLARRSIPLWAVCLSFVATEINAMMLIGIPAVAFRENWQYAQFFIGVAAARVVIAHFFIPALYYYPCTTIYEFLKHRFGPLTQYAGSSFFLAARLLGSGVRLFSAAIVISALLGWHVVPSILLFTVVGTAYLAYGGIRAAVWTGVMQVAVFVAAGLAAILFLSWHVQGGIGAAWAIADSAGRLSLFNFGLSSVEAGTLDRFFADPNVFWFAVFNGFFGSLVTTASDYELMQRLLMLKTPEAGRRAMLYTIPASLGVMVLYLCIGTGLFVYYAQHPELALPAQIDRIFPHFTVQVMPVVLRGLVLSAIFMASVDLPGVSLAASFATDLYRPLLHPVDGKYRDRIAKFSRFLQKISIFLLPSPPSSPARGEEKDAEFPQVLPPEAENLSAMHAAPGTPGGIYSPSAASKDVRPLPAAASGTAALGNASEEDAFHRCISKILFIGRRIDWGSPDLYVPRIGVVVCGLMLAVIACFFSYEEQMLWLGFKIGAATLGPLLGVFLLGIFTHHRADRAAAGAMLVMGIFNLSLLSLSESGVFSVGWNWLMIFGALGTFALGRWSRQLFERVRMEWIRLRLNIKERLRA